MADGEKQRSEANSEMETLEMYDNATCIPPAEYI